MLIEHFSVVALVALDETFNVAYGFFYESSSDHVEMVETVGNWIGMTEEIIYLLNFYYKLIVYIFFYYDKKMKEF